MGFIIFIVFAVSAIAVPLTRQREGETSYSYATRVGMIVCYVLCGLIIFASLLLIIITQR